MNPKAKKQFLWIHAGLLAAAVVFPLYVRLARALSGFTASGCFLHDRLFLYCPLCGGTRAVEAMLQLQPGRAFSYNPLVVIGVCVLLALDVIALVRLLRGNENLYPIPGWAWITAAVVLVCYGVLRNYLMIRYGYDPTGDLVRFWKPGG